LFSESLAALEDGPWYPPGRVALEDPLLGEPWVAVLGHEGVREGPRRQIGVCADLDQGQPDVGISRDKLADAVEQAHADRPVAEEDSPLGEPQELCAELGVLSGVGADGEGQGAQQEHTQSQAAESVRHRSGSHPVKLFIWEMRATEGCLECFTDDTTGHPKRAKN
jgi:hypothetical protein